MRDLLIRLQRESKPRKEKWAKVQQYVTEICQARERGVAWSAIAETLNVDGIDVSAVSLRLFIAKFVRDGKSNARSKSGRMSRTTIVRGQKGAENGTPVGDQDRGVEDNHDEELVRKDPFADTTLEKSQHAGPRRKNQRV